MNLKKKILTMLLLAISANAAVFDYRLYYGTTSSRSKTHLVAASANVYSYFTESNFAYGVQFDALRVRPVEPITYINSASALLGYDFLRTVHGEIEGGMSIMMKTGHYKKGYHGAVTILTQSNFESYLEAIQIGITARFDKFPDENIKDEKGIQVFMGLGF